MVTNLSKNIKFSILPTNAERSDLELNCQIKWLHWIKWKFVEGCVDIGFFDKNCAGLEWKYHEMLFKSSWINNV